MPRGPAALGREAAGQAGGQGEHDGCAEVGLQRQGRLRRTSKAVLLPAAGRGGRQAVPVCCSAAGLVCTLHTTRLIGQYT